MKIDENKDTVLDTEITAGSQNRREFFNGLGKWSMIVVATVSALRGSFNRILAGREATGRAEREPLENAFQRLAKKPKPHHQHVDIGTGHFDSPHQDVPHVDRNVIMQ